MRLIGSFRRSGIKPILTSDRMLVVRRAVPFVVGDLRGI